MPPPMPLVDGMAPCQALLPSAVDRPHIHCSALSKVPTTRAARLRLQRAPTRTRSSHARKFRPADRHQGLLTLLAAWGSPSAHHRGCRPSRLPSGSRNWQVDHDALRSPVESLTSGALQPALLVNAPASLRGAQPRVAAEQMLGPPFPSRRGAGRPALRARCERQPRIR